MTYQEREDALRELIQLMESKPKTNDHAPFLALVRIVQDINRELLTIIPMLASLTKNHTEQLAHIQHYLQG